MRKWILVLMAVNKPAYYSNDMSEMQLFCFGEMELSVCTYVAKTCSDFNVYKYSERIILVESTFPCRLACFN